MKTIELTRGLSAIVDDDDFEALNAHKWYAQRGRNTHYAARRENGSRAMVLMHSLLAGTPSGMVTDHINGNGLDNRRENLRAVTVQQNIRNRTRKAEGCSSQFRGVCWSETRRKWEATITFDGRSKHLGRFGSEHAAAQAYDDAGRALYRGHFTPNFNPVTIEISR